MCTFVRELVNISVFGPWQPLMEHLFWKFMYPHLNYGGIIYDETFQKEFFLFQWIKPALPIRQRCDQYQSCMYSLMKLILVVFSCKMFCFLMLQPFFGKIWEKLNYGLFGLIWIDSQNLLYIFILSFPRKYEVW